MEYPAWIAVDWGTSHLRAWGMSGDGHVLQNAQSADGMGALAPAEFEPALMRLIGSWLTDARIDILACGMVGARQGWVEALYLPTPCKPADAPLTYARTVDPRLNVMIIPGISQAHPADVMRGEETQILGLLAETPDFDGVLCLPGTHTKWVHISAGEVVSFQTVMTGELFALLSKSSVLRHSVGGSDTDRAAFDAAISDTLSRPERLTQSLFSIRAASLLADQSDAAGRGCLSGLLIGAELAATRPYWLGREVCIGGAADLCTLYAQALEAQGLSVTQMPGDVLTLRGLCHTYSLREA